MAIGERGEGSATLALPACHPTSAADIYIFTVGLFYRGLQRDKHRELEGSGGAPKQSSPSCSERPAEGPASPDSTGNKPRAKELHRDTGNPPPHQQHQAKPVQGVCFGLGKQQGKNPNQNKKHF